MSSAIIIRLQNLPLEANSLDIRRFFQRLHIPDGGVHIVGGENGDAFIAFDGDEDARQAMERNGNLIKGSRIKLLLSSRNEMQRVIEAARNQTMSIMSNNNNNQNNNVPGTQQPPPPPSQTTATAAQVQVKPNVIGGIGGGVGVGTQQPSIPNMAASAVVAPGVGIVGATNNQYPPQPPPLQQQQQYPSSIINQQQPQPSGPGYYPGQQQPLQPTQSGPIPYGIVNNNNNRGGPGPQHQQQQGFRARSRSRSRSPPRSSASASQQQQQQPTQPISSMHTGLLGSLPSSVSSSQSQQQPQPTFQNVPPSQHGGYVGGDGRFPPNNEQQPQQQFQTTSWNQSDDRFRNVQPPPVVGGGNDDMFRKLDSMHQSQQRTQPPILNNNSFGQQQPGYGHQQQFHSNSNSNNNNIVEPLIQQTPQQSNLFPTQPSSSSSTTMVVSSQQQQPSQPPPIKMFTLQLFDLPFNVRPIDLIKFFHPLFLNEDNIKIFYDEKGFPTGMALIRFPSPREFESALGFNNRFLGERRIQIRPLDEMNGPTTTNNNSNSNNNGPPPPLISQQPQPLLKPNNALMPTPPTEPYRMDSYPPPPPSSYREDFKRGPPSSSSSSPHQISYNGPPSSTTGGSVSQKRKELVLYLKGLPFKNCSVKDVAGFFEPLKLVHIEIELDPRGRPTGNAFVEFRDKHDVDRGMEYNMRHMGRRYIELIPLLMYEKYGPNYHSAPPPPKHSRPGGGGSSSSGNSPPITYCVSVRGLSKHVTSKDLKSFFSQYKAETYAVHIMLTPDRMNAGEAFLEFLTKENQIRALKVNGYRLGDDRITVKHVPYETVRKAVPPPSSSSSSGGRSSSSDSFNHHKSSRDRDRRDHRHSRSGGGMPPFADKAAILRARNISIKSNIEDLCEFFSHYRITPNRIKLKEDLEAAAIDPEKKDSGQDDISQTTLMAHISFFSKADAEHAHRNMDKKYFIDRKINLTFV